MQGDPGKGDTNLGTGVAACVGLTDQGRHRWDTVEEGMAGGHRQRDSPRLRYLSDSDLWEWTLGTCLRG